MHTCKHMLRRPKTKNSFQQSGFEIIEAIIALGIVSTLLVVLIAARNSTQLQVNTYNRTLARQLIVEEYEALRNSSYATLTGYTETSGLDFIEVPYNTGSWAISSPGVACAACTGGGGKAYTATTASGINDPSIQVIPNGKLSDGTYETYFRVQNSSPPGWKVGLYIRYHDTKDYYLVQVSASTLQMLRNIRGTTTALAPATTSISLNKNVWYKLSVTATGSSFSVTINGTTASYTDTTFSNGYFLLGVMAGATADFDDVVFTNAASGLSPLLWTFNAANNTIGEPAYQWRRIGPASLPSGTTALSISNYVNGGTTYTDLKTLTLTVSWLERNTTRSVTNTLYINQQDSAP